MSKKIRFSPRGFLDFFGKTVFDTAHGQNHALCLTGYRYKSPKVPENFDGFRILQLSDMHNCVYGREAERLIKIAERNKPDVIVITGDSFDSRRCQYFDSLDIIKKLTSVCPVYFITGNHEELSPRLRKIFLTEITKSGVKVLDGETAKITRGEDTVYLSGISDFTSFAPEMGLLQKALDKNLDCEELNSMKDAFREKLKAFSQKKPEGFNVLLSHRPEMHEAYSENGYDLVFCGHAHGGQFRIPPVGAIYSPGQGFFPKYSEGPHLFGNTTMIVSRGMGNSSFPIRINNKPEIVLCEIHK